MNLEIMFSSVGLSQLDLQLGYRHLMLPLSTRQNRAAPSFLLKEPATLLRALSLVVVVWHGAGP